MVKKLLRLLLVSVLVFPMSTLFVQPAPAQEKMDKMDKMPKKDRWEGNITRVSQDKSTLTVRKVGSTDERNVMWDSSTRWVSQAHGSKTVNDIDATQVKDGDRVICEGTWDKDGALHATLISKRLSH